jgi:Protein of unknown function (DUF3606)
VNHASPEFSQADSSLHAQPIDINRESALSYWLAKLGCSEFELRVAVAEVGPYAGDVSDRLGVVV